MKCRVCGAENKLRRDERKGFLQKSIFSRFGFYPWECIVCRGISLHRKRHAARRPRPEQTEEELVGSER